MDTEARNVEGQLIEPDRDTRAEIPVLIVGGGPIGLTISLLLSHHGVRSLLVEQHPGTSIYPKARVINARTMEIFRQIGIEQAIRDVAIPHTRNVVYASSLAGQELFRRPLEKVIPEAVRNWSPTWGCTSTQNVVEPVLFGQAR
jgi:putative polyketide hydroxylase